MTVEERREYDRMYYAEHPEYREKSKARSKVYREAHSEELKEKKKLYDKQRSESGYFRNEWAKKKDIINAKRREKYKQDKEYREKVKKRAFDYIQTERGKEMNRMRSLRNYYKDMSDNYYM